MHHSSPHHSGSFLGRAVYANSSIGPIPGFTAINRSHETSADSGEAFTSAKDRQKCKIPLSKLAKSQESQGVLSGTPLVSIETKVACQSSSSTTFRPPTGHHRGDRRWSSDPLDPRGNRSGHGPGPPPKSATYIPSEESQKKTPLPDIGQSTTSVSGSKQHLSIQKTSPPSIHPKSCSSNPNTKKRWNVLDNTTAHARQPPHKKRRRAQTASSQRATVASYSTDASMWKLFGPALSDFMLNPSQVLKSHCRGLYR